MKDRVSPKAMSKRVRSGFTLVELLLVVALIAIIISLLMPALRLAKEDANTVVCQSNLRQFANASYSYAQQNLGWLLPIRGEDGSYWMSNAEFRSLLGEDEIGSDFKDGYRCPSLHPQAVGSGGQRSNFYGWNRTPIGFGDLPITFTRNRVKTPSKKFQLLDGTDWHIWRDYANPIANWDTYRHTRLWSVAYRHRETVNIAHFDGHISNYSKDFAYPADPLERESVWNIDY